jgi:hypothetical protein
MSIAARPHTVQWFDDVNYVHGVSLSDVSRVHAEVL